MYVPKTVKIVKAALRVEYSGRIVIDFQAL